MYALAKQWPEGLVKHSLETNLQASCLIKTTYLEVKTKVSARGGSITIPE